METPELPAPFLVMAHHRSGSNFVNDLLQSHPAIECLNEPLSMHTRFFRDCDLAHWSGADYDPRDLHPALARQEDLRDYLVELRQYLLRSTHGRVMGFKETVLFGKLEWLKAYLPDLKIVFLTREPCAIVSSVLRSGLFEFWRYGELVPKTFHALYPHYESRVDAADASTREAEIAAMSVAARHELARRSMHLFDHRVVPLETVMQEPASAVKSLTEFLGVAAHPDPESFLMRRQAMSRGGTFSSFRAADDVQATWRRHLSARQVEAIQCVMAAARLQTSAGTQAAGNAA